MMTPSPIASVPGLHPAVLPESHQAAGRHHVAPDGVDGPVDDAHIELVRGADDAAVEELTREHLLAQVIEVEEPLREMARLGQRPDLAQPELADALAVVHEHERRAAAGQRQRRRAEEDAPVPLELARVRLRQRAVDPGLELAAEGQEAGHRRQHGEDDQRRRHAARRLVRMRGVDAVLAGLRLFATAVLAEERHVDHAHHVGGGQARGEQPQHEDALVVQPRVDQDLVLRPEAGEGDNPRQCQRADPERDERDRHRHPQPAHLAHVEGVGRVVDRAGAEEQQRLEERVRHQVEDRRRVAAHADREHHVGQLADRRIGQHALDVGLHQRQQRRPEGRARSDPGDQVAGRGRGLDHGEEARQQVDAGRDHRGRVDQRRDGRRALHRVGQPDVQRELRALADRAGDQAQREQRDDGLAEHHAVDQQQLSAVVDLSDVERAGAVPDQDQRREQAEVAQPRDQERLLRRGGGGRLVEPEADQEVRGDADQLPEDEEHQQVAGQDQAEHRRGEQRHEHEVAPVAVVGLHVAGRIDLHEQRDARHDDQHHRGQAVDPDAQLDVERPRCEERVRPVAERVTVDSDRLNQRPDGEQEGDEQRRDQRRRGQPRPAEQVRDRLPGARVGGVPLGGRAGQPRIQREPRRDRERSQRQQQNDPEDGFWHVRYTFRRISRATCVFESGT